MDQETGYWQNEIFHRIAKLSDHVKVIDYRPILFKKNIFYPISKNGEYLMYDRHHLTELGSLLLTNFFRQNILNL